MSGRSLTQRSVSAAAWSLAFQFIGRLITPVIGILLARRLSPADYGLIGMLGIFWAVGAIFTDGGFGIALLRKKDPEPIEYDSVFCYNLALGVLIYLGLFWGAPWIAAFYRQPALVPIVRVSALTFIAGPFGSIPSLLLQKQMEHRVISAVHIAVGIMTGAVAIGLAHWGKGVWALVWQQLLSVVVSSAMLALYTRWVPSGRFSLAALKRLFGFSSRLMMTRVMNAFFNNIYTLMIGRFYSPQDVGYFTRGNSYAGLWSLSLFGTVESVTFPAYAEIQENRERFRKALRRSLFFTMTVCAFPTALVAFLGRPLIRFVLTEQWEPLVPYLWIFSCVHVCTVLQSFHSQVLLIYGRSDLDLRLSFAKRILTVGAVLLTVRYGALALSAGQLAVALLITPVAGIYSSRLLAYSLRAQWDDAFETIWPALVAGMFAWFGSYLLELYGARMWMGIVAGVGIGGGTYWALLWFRKQALLIGLEIVGVIYPHATRWRLFQVLKSRIQNSKRDLFS